MRTVLRQWIKWFYLLIATALIVLAVLVQLGRSFFHLLGEHEPAIAAYLSEKLNAQVSLGHITARWDDLKPNVQVRDLLIKSPSGQSIVALQRAQMRLDIIGTILHGRLVWDDLILSDVSMAFVQQPDGSWHVQGLPKRTPDTEPAQVNLDALVDMLLLSGHIEFLRSHFTFYFTSGQHLVLGSPSALLENKGQFHRLSLQVDIDNQPRSVQLIMEAEGDPRDLRHFRSRGYLALNKFPTSEPIAAVTALLLNGVDKSTLSSDGSVNASIWFQTRDQDEGYDVSGRLAVQTLAVPIAGHPVRLDGFSTDLVGHWLPGGEWHLGLQKVSATVGLQQIHEINLGVSSSGFNQPLTFAMDQLDLGNLARLLSDAGALGTGKLQEVLLALAPRGQLRNLELTLPPADPKAWKLRANVSQVAVTAWQGVPGLTGVDGYVQADQRGGVMDINSHQHFSMHYASIYDAPMAYDSAKGQVAWHLWPDKNQIYVNSGALEFRKDTEHAKGYLWLSMPWRRNTGDIDLYLQIGARQLNAGLYRKYIPSTVPDTLLAWLNQSIGEHNSGMAREGGFVYRGTLNTKNPMARTYQLYLDIGGAELNYHTGWPSLSQVDGRLLIKDSTVLASISAGRVQDSELEYAEVRSAPRTGRSSSDTRPKGSLLHIRGGIKGPASDGIKVLRESMLRQYLGNNLDTWQVQGTLQTELDLAIPLGAEDAQPADAYQRVGVDLEASQFELGNLNLHLEQVQGHIEYHSASGIVSDRLVARLFDQPITIQMHTDHQGDYKTSRIDVEGAVDVHQLAQWSKRPEVLFLTGLIPYQAQVALNHRPRTGARARTAPVSEQAALTQSPAEFVAQAFATVDVTSNLQGVSVALPAPYGKPAQDERRLDFRLSLQDQQSQVDVNYHDNVQALLRMSRGDGSALRYANIALASEPSLSSTPQFLVSGYLPTIDLPAWKTVQSRYEDYASQLAGTKVSAATGSPASGAHADVGAVAGLPFKAELVLGHYDIGPLTLKDLGVSATRTELGWQLGLENPMVSGDVVIPTNTYSPFQVNLQRLHLDDAVLGEAGLDKSGSDQPSPDQPSPDQPGPDQSGSEEPALSASTNTDINTNIDTSTNTVEPKASIDPRSLPRVNIAVNELFVGQNNYGSWSLQMRPNRKGVVIDHIRGRIRGVSVSGMKDERDTGAKLIWQHTDQGVQTRFIGRFSADDIGDVLRQWQKPDMIESKSAHFNADLYWLGAPQDFKLVELNGDMDISMEDGRFRRDVGAGDGILRLVSILNFDTLARRLRLDFSDLYKSGLAYDDIDGKVSFNQGTLIFAEPLEVRTPSSEMQMAGTIDLRQETLDTRLVATLPVASNLTFFAALATGLPAAAGIYLVSRLFKKQVDQAGSVSYTITGNWDKPKMRFDRLFESEESLRDSVQNNKAKASKPDLSDSGDQPAKP